MVAPVWFFCIISSRHLDFLAISMFSAYERLCVESKAVCCGVYFIFLLGVMWNWHFRLADSAIALIFCSCPTRPLSVPMKYRSFSLRGNRGLKESVGLRNQPESIGFGIFRVEGVRFGEQITEQDSLLRSAAFRVVLEDGVPEEKAGFFVRRKVFFDDFQIAVVINIEK